MTEWEVIGPPADMNCHVPTPTIPVGYQGGYQNEEFGWHSGGYHMSQKTFYLIKRSERLTNGKPTYYARLRNETGELMAWRSTGETNKGRAEAWALKRLDATTTDERITFTRFAEGWWTDGHPHVKGRRARGVSLSPGYLDVQRGYLANHVLPYFGDKKLVKIRAGHIDEWMLALALSPTTVNHCLTVVKAMFREAKRQGLIATDPTRDVGQLAERPETKQILTLGEVKTLFGGVRRIWNRDHRHFAANLLAASTGMRMGEVQGLQVQHVHSQYVAVVHAWSRKHGLKNPKQGSAREVPIPPKTSVALERIIEPGVAPESLVFCGVDPCRPIDHKKIGEKLYAALEEIGIDEAERKRRRVSFHSWRYLFNTLCRARIPDYKLQRLTGHRMQEMTERYTSITLEDFQDVAELQAEVFS